MADRTLVYFVSDVHLGLDVNDPADREARFVSFLKSIPKDSSKVPVPSWGHLGFLVRVP